MAEFEVTTEDINRSKVLVPTWYPFVIKAVVDKPSKAGDSINTVIDFAGLEGSPAAGKEIREYMSHKIAPGVFVPLAKALNGGELKPGKIKIDESLVGEKVDCYVGVDEYQGRKKNIMVDYRPYRKSE